MRRMNEQEESAYLVALEAAPRLVALYGTAFSDRAKALSKTIRFCPPDDAVKFATIQAVAEFTRNARLDEAAQKWSGWIAAHKLDDDDFLEALRQKCAEIKSVEGITTFCDAIEWMVKHYVIPEDRRVVAGTFVWDRKLGPYALHYDSPFFAVPTTRKYQLLEGKTAEARLLAALERGEREADKWAD